MIADLHVHSVYSDGLYSPDEICRKAAARGISLLSITDHDTLSGLEVKRQAALRHGISYLSGWEVSAYAGAQKVHILGYGCQDGEAYRHFTETRKAAAFERAKDSMEKFRAMGIPVSYQEVLDRRSAPDLPVHTMHIARAVAPYLGITDGEVYREYLAIGKPANSNIGRPTPEQAIDCIHEAGGIASIAHPGRLEMTEEEREKTLKALLAYGADGIECFYTTHTDKDTEYFLSLARETGALVTGGSDTHYEEETHRIGNPCFTPDKRLLEALKISL